MRVNYRNRLFMAAYSYVFKIAPRESYSKRKKTKASSSSSLLVAFLTDRIVVRKRRECQRDVKHGHDRMEEKDTIASEHVPPLWNNRCATIVRPATYNVCDVVGQCKLDSNKTNYHFRFSNTYVCAL